MTVIRFQIRLGTLTCRYFCICRCIRDASPFVMINFSKKSYSSTTQLLFSSSFFFFCFSMSFFVAYDGVSSIERVLSSICFLWQNVLVLARATALNVMPTQLSLEKQVSFLSLKRIFFYYFPILCYFTNSIEETFVHFLFTKSRVNFDRLAEKDDEACVCVHFKTEEKYA